VTWRTCLSDEAREWFASAARANGTESQRAGVRFQEVIRKRLEPFGPFGAESARLTKIQDDLWEVRRDAFRMFLGFGPGQLIIVSNVLVKRRGRLPQRVYDQESMKLAQLMNRAVTGSLEC
jgi:hypothetical protein